MNDVDFNWQGFWEMLLNPGQWTYYHWGTIGISILALLLCIPLFRWCLQSIKESLDKTSYKPNLRAKKSRNNLNKSP